MIAKPGKSPPTVTNHPRLGADATATVSAAEVCRNVLDINRFSFQTKQLRCLTEGLDDLMKLNRNAIFVAVLAALALVNQARSASDVPASAPATSGQTIVNVTVTNIEPGGGYLYVSLCTEKQFLKANCAARSRVMAKSSTETVRVGPVPYGRYAVQVWHDIDADGVFDTYLFGIPSEPTGLSRDATGKFGPPKFEDAVLNLASPVVAVTVNLY